MRLESPPLGRGAAQWGRGSAGTLNRRVRLSVSPLTRSHLVFFTAFHRKPFLPTDRFSEHSRSINTLMFI